MSEAEDETRRSLWLVRLAAFGPLVLGVGAYLFCAPFARALDEGVGLLVRGDLAGLRRWGVAQGAWAPLATSLLMVIQALAAPIPAVLVTATNSFLFGWVAGGALSIVSATLAACLCHLLARSCGDPLVRRLVPAESLARADELIARHGVTAVLVARLLPFVPFDPISYAAGLARMPLLPFFWATLAGQIPAGMTYAYLAGQLDRPAATLLVMLPSALLALAVFGWSIRRLLLK